MVHQGNGGRMPARTERYLPERMNSFIQAGVRAGKNGIMEWWNKKRQNCRAELCSAGKRPARVFPKGCLWQENLAESVKG